MSCASHVLLRLLYIIKQDRLFGDTASQPVTSDQWPSPSTNSVMRLHHNNSVGKSESWLLSYINPLYVSDLVFIIRYWNFILKNEKSCPKNRWRRQKNEENKMNLKYPCKNHFMISDFFLLQRFDTSRFPSSTSMKKTEEKKMIVPRDRRIDHPYSMYLPVHVLIKHST